MEKTCKNCQSCGIPTKKTRKAAEQIPKEQNRKCIAVIVIKKELLQGIAR